MNSPDQYSYREASPSSDEYAYREVSPPYDEYEFHETSLPAKESMFLPILVESPEDSPGRADLPPKAPTLSPVLLSPGSTTQKLIAAGKIKNCIILLKKASLDHSPLGHLTSNETAKTAKVPLETELSKDLFVDNLEELREEVTSSPSCHRDDSVDSETLDVVEDPHSTNRNIFASLLGEWPDAKMDNSTTVEDHTCTESTSSTIIADCTEDTNQISSSSQEICRSVSSSNASDPIADCRSIQDDDEFDQVKDSRSENGDITGDQTANYQSEMGANTICRIVDCRSISTNDISVETTDCRSMESDTTEINPITDKQSEINIGTIDGDSECRLVNKNNATNSIPDCRTEPSVKDIDNCSSMDTDTALNPTDITESTVDQTTSCQSFTDTDTDVSGKVPLPEFYERSRSSCSDDLMSISSTGSGETLQYPLSPDENFPERFEILEDDQCCAETEVSEGAEVAERICDGPPLLERLESLPTPGSCLDLPPVLSPPMLTLVNDDIQPEARKHSAGSPLRVSRDRKASLKAPPSGSARRELHFGVETAEPPMISPGVTEITKDKSQKNQKQSDSGTLEKHTSPAGVLPPHSTDSSEKQTEQSECGISLRDSVPSEHLPRELRGSGSDVSFPSPPNKTKSSDQETFRVIFPNLMDFPPPRKGKIQDTTALPQENQYCEVESQVADRSDDPVDNARMDPQRGSVGDLQITEVVSLGEVTPAVRQELPENQGDKPDCTLVMPPFSGQKTDSTASCVDRNSSVYGRDLWADDSLQAVFDSEESKTLATAVHSSLSDINSETEMERAVASISDDNQQSNVEREQECPVNIFEGNIEVAEVVIDPHDENASPSTNEVGIMFSLDHTTVEKDSGSQNMDEIPLDTLKKDQGDTCPTSDKEAHSPQDIQKSETSQSDQGVAEDGIPAREKTSSVERVKGSQQEESDGHPQRPSNLYQVENMRGSSETCAPKETRPGLVMDTSSTSPTPQARVSPSATSRHAQQELPPRSNILSNNQSISSSRPDSSKQMIDLNDTSVRINTTEVSQASCLKTTAPLDRNQISSSDEANNTGRITDNPSFSRSSSVEMDTAISLALMSEMAASVGAKESRSNQVTSKDKAPSSSAPPPTVPSVPHDIRVDTRTRHLSAPRMSDSIRREETPRSTRTPNSVHGANGHGDKISSEVPPTNQNTTSRTSRGGNSSRHDSGFVIVDCSGPMPRAPNNNQFDELKQRLMQDRIVNLTQGQSAATTPKLTASQNLLDPSVCYRSINLPQDGWSGVPVEFPDGKRFIAYNKESCHLLPVRQLGNPAEGLAGAHDQFCAVVTNGPSTSNGGVEHTVQYIQLQRPDTVSYPNSYQRPIGSNNLSLSNTQHIVENPRHNFHSATSAETGLSNDNQQQPHSTDARTSLGFSSSHGQKIPADHVEYPVSSFQGAWEGRAVVPPNRSIGQLPLPVRGIDGVRAVSTHASEYTTDYFGNQQHLFNVARGFVAPPKPQRGRSPGHDVNGVNSSLYQQNGSRCPEDIPMVHLHSQVTGTLTKTSQSVGQGAFASSVQHLPGEGEGSGRDAVVCTPVLQSIDRSGQQELPTGRPMSASSFMSDLAERNRRHQLNQNTDGNRDFPLQLQRDGPANRHERIASSSMSNATNQVSREHMDVGINLIANHRPVYQDQPAQVVEGNRNKVTPISGLSSKESAFLGNLPTDLAKYLYKQREQGIPITKALKTLLELEEEEERTAKQQKRVWRSTIHYPPSNASEQNDVSSCSVSVASTHTTSQMGHNQEPRTTTANPSGSNAVLSLGSQNSGVENYIHSDAQFRQNAAGHLHKIPKMARNFYNPPPSLTPLLEADVVAPSTCASQTHTAILDSPENIDSALDLRTRTLGSDIEFFNEDHPLVSQFSFSNTNLYHRAYTAGEPGPIRASSLVNLSLAATEASPVMADNLSPTQLLIRSKLLERRLRIQSKSISTPDIVQGYSYPPTRKRVRESSIQTRKVLTSQKPPEPTGISNGNAHEVGHSSLPASSHSDGQDVGSVNKVTLREIQGEVTPQNLTIANKCVPVSESSAPIHYPKVKANLQIRWVAEKVKFTQAPASDHRVSSPGLDRQNAHGAQVVKAQDQPVHPTTGSSSDHVTVQPSTLPVEKGPTTSKKITSGKKSKKGPSRASQPQRKRKAEEVSPFRPTCPFCAFEAPNSWSLRTHVNRQHFEKHSKPETTKRGSAKAARKSQLGKTSKQRSPNTTVSNVRTNPNGQLMTVIPKSVPPSVPVTVLQSVPPSFPQLVPALVPQSIPHSVPQSIPHSVPHSVPQSIPHSVPQSVPQSVPALVPQSIPHSVPQSVPALVPQSISHSVPQSVPALVPQSVPASVSQSVPRSVPQSIPHSVPQSVPHSVPALVPQSIPQSVPALVPQSVPASVPQSVPRSVPQSIPHSVPQSIPAVVPQSVPHSVPQSIPAVVPQSVSRNSGDNVHRHRQIASGLTATVNANATAVSSPTSTRPTHAAASVPFTDHQQITGLRPEATSLVTHPATNGSHAVEPTTAKQAGVGLFICRYCSLPFKTSQELLIHIKFQHTNTKGQNMCFNCGYTTKYNSTLMKHIVKWHGRSKGDDKTFKCSQLKCKEAFSTEEELQQHYSSHEAQRTYSCDLCNAKYKHITGLRYHQSRHTLNYPHKCLQCGLKFKSTGMLQRHEFQKKHFSS